MNEHKVKYAGETYMIPDIWIAGFCRNGRSIMDAIRHWHEQAQLEKLWLAQQEERRPAG